MNPLLSIVACTLLAAALSPQPPGKGWRGIEPLRSTRADVERLLGRPETEAGGVYATAAERVSVSYSHRPCDYGWQVAPDTVISFFVYPKQPPKLADLKLDEKKYEMRKDLHLAVHYYLDPEAGINYTVDSTTGLVTGVEYYPPLKSKAPRCQPPAEKPSKTRPADSRVRRGRRNPARP